MWKLVLVCLLPLVANLPTEELESDREARLGNFLQTLTSAFQKPQQSPPLVYIQGVNPTTITTAATQTACQINNGRQIGSKCYAYFSEHLSYAAAATACKNAKGTLWVPDIKNPHLWKELFTFIELFGATNQDVWIGIKRNMAGIFMGVDSVSYSSNPLILARQGPVDDCLTINFEYGSFYLRGEDCDTTNDYICTFH